MHLHLYNQAADRMKFLTLEFYVRTHFMSAAAAQLKVPPSKIYELSFECHLLEMP